jgi:hypothetical protein
MRNPLITLALGLVLLAGCRAAPGTAAPADDPTAQTGTAAKPAPVASAQRAPQGARGSGTLAGSFTRPAAATSPTPGCDADFSAFNITKDTFLSAKEYVDGRWGQVRFIKAPTEAEEKAMKDGFGQEHKAADANGDGKLSLEEFRTTCR